MARNRLSETPTQATLSMPEIRFYSGSTYEPYKWQSNNNDLQVVQLLEQRSKEAADAQAKYNTQLSQLKNVLNPAESDWIKEKEQEIDDTISAYILSNDYAGLRNYVTQAPSQLLKSNEYLNRVKAQEKYLEAQKLAQDKLNKGEIDNITYQRWNEENQYSYQDEFDAAGNVTLSAPWTSNWTPVTKVNWENLVINAFKEVTPKTVSTDTTTQGYSTGGKSVTYGGTENLNGSNIYLNDNSWSQHNRYESAEVALEDIVANLKSTINTDAYNSIKQDYRDRLFELNKIEQELSREDTNEAYKSDLEQRRKYLRGLLYNNGSIASIDNYMTHMVENNAIAKNLKYRKISTSGGSAISPLKTTTTEERQKQEDDLMWNPVLQTYEPREIGTSTPAEVRVNPEEEKAKGNAAANSAVAWGKTLTSNNGQTNTRK